MVGAALDRTVVRVDGLQVETVLRDGANHRHGHLVAAVLVHVVVDVEHVLLGAAVADHVALPHVDDVVLGLEAGRGVLQAAPETLLFPGKMQEADLDVVRDGQTVEGLGNLEDGDRARSIVIGTRSDLLVRPGVAGRRVEVRTEDVDALLRAGHLARDLGFEVEVGLAANRVRHTGGGDLERAVELLEPRHCQVDALAMRAAALQRDAPIADIDRLFAGHATDQVGKLVFANASQYLLDEGLTGRQIGDVDRRHELVRGRTNDFSAELARAVFAVPVNVNLSVVSRVEVGLERDDWLTIRFGPRAQATEKANDQVSSHANKRGDEKKSKHGIFLSVRQSCYRREIGVRSAICCKNSAVARSGKARISKAETSSQLTAVVVRG